MKKMVTCLLTLIVLRPALLSADHSLSQIEEDCEVYKYSHSYGELDCRGEIRDERALVGNCEIHFFGEYGTFYCRGVHFRDVESKCDANLYTSDYAEIEC